MSARGAFTMAVRAALFSGSVASLASTLALMAFGKRDTGAAATPLNGPSQWVFGKHAPYQDGFRLRYTPIGLAIHYGCSIFWAIAFELTAAYAPLAAARRTLPAAIGTVVVAYAVDYHLTPRRFRPGFEQRLRRDSLFGVYAAFALGLAAARQLRALARARSD